MKKRGRSSEQALLRTSVSKKNQTFSQKRLIKDLIQIQQEKIPTVGVTARPLDKDIFTWHANIRGPEGTLYQGAVFHLQIVFPRSYPHHPPTISLFNTIPHPNVFGSYICLDMICQHDKPTEGGGWSSAYSVQSVLTQLQSFLFEQNLSQNKQRTEMQIKKAIKQADSFKCRKCKHGGKLSCWPQFSVKQNQKENFVILEDENQIIKKQLVCFHTKLPFTENALGIALKISKVPRTGNIREAETFYDYISVRAFMKESINKTSYNERFTHWMPVYFGKCDNDERFEKFLTHAISMIMTNSTRNFKKQFVLEVFPKIMITLIYHIMDQKKHASIRQIRVLAHIHSMFLYCLKKYPQLIEKINNQVRNFIKDENARIKDNQPNLGAILAMISGTDSHKFCDVSQAYFNEQLDRQVLWILKSVPQLLDQTMDQDVDEKRAQIVFKSQKTSYHILCFYKLFLTQICESRKSREAMLQEYENNLCKLTNKQEDYFQQRIFDIQKNINTYEDFFKYTGIKARSKEQITYMLKDAIKNSQRKKYHGQLETLHELPDSSEQFKKILEKIPSYRKYINIKTEQKVQGKKTDYIYHITEEKSQDSDWKDMCINRWPWIKESIVYEKQLTARQISARALDYSKQGILKPEDRLQTINKKYLNKQIDHRRPNIDVPQTTWKQLFLRLDLQDFLLYIDMNPDFTSLYQKLEVCHNQKINTLLIPMVEVTQIKSGYYYLTSILTKLPSLKHIQFSGLPQSHRLKQKAAKAIKKGFHNFIEAKGVLDIITFHNIIVDKDYSDSLFEYINNTESLKSIRFQKTNMLNDNAVKVLSRSLTNIKNLNQIRLNEAQLDEGKCKTIADVLMRTKKLKIFEIHNAQNLTNGLASIIYNLSFSPNLEVLDISRTCSNIGETIISLYKLLKISGSIQLIYASSITNLNTSLNKQFWLSLGENQSLRVLDISSSGSVIGRRVEIGNSIGFNAKKRGALEYIDLRNCLSGANNLQEIYKGMCISEYDQQVNYGDPNKASKMIASNYQKKYYNNLKALQLNFNSSLQPNFNLAHHNKLITKKQPNYVSLLANSPKLTSVQMKACSLRKNFAQILVLALDPRRQNFCSTIRVLDLSKNNFAKEGIKALTEIIPYNNILEVLDLSKNQLGVSGAHELAVSLKNNKSLKYLNLFNNKIGFDGAKSVAENILATHPTLQCLELGHNRIRDKGLKSVTDCLISNKNSSVKILGLRFNFIGNIGATYFFNKITSNKTKLEQVFLKNNYVDDTALNNLEMIKEHQKSPIYIDMLQKLKYLDVQRNERTIWIHPIQNINLQNLRKFFEITYKCGIVIDARIRRGKKYANKMGENLFGLIEFADTNSVNRALRLASEKLTIVDGIRFRIYKAGTGTFIFAKKTSKQKKLEVAKRGLPPVPYGIAQADRLNGVRMPASRMRGGRGRGGRGFGRGRGRR